MASTNGIDSKKILIKKSHQPIKNLKVPPSFESRWIRIGNNIDNINNITFKVLINKNSKSWLWQTISTFQSLAMLFSRKVSSFANLISKCNSTHVTDLFSLGVHVRRHSLLDIFNFLNTMTKLHATNLWSLHHCSTALIIEYCNTN